MAEENNNKDKNNEYEDICYVCRRPESKAGKMMRLPQGICICNDCMQKTFDTINNSDINYDDLMNNMPNMGMFGGFNMMGNDISNRQKVKKKKEDNNKPTDKEKDDTLDLDNLPAPHQIKAMLDEYVIRTMPRRLCQLLYTIIIRELPQELWTILRLKSLICL